MKTAFLFAGQGAQYVGMTKDIFDKYPDTRHVFEIAKKVVKKDIDKICFQGSKEDLDLTENTQPCLLASDICIYLAVAERGIVPDVVAGFSLGEYASLVAAGCLDIESAFELIQIRAKAMQEAVPLGKGAMAAVMSKSGEIVQNICDSVSSGYVAPSNYNCPGQIVVAGDKAAVEEFCTVAKEKGLRSAFIPVSVPSHCEMMRSAAYIIEKELEGMNLSDAIKPLYMNVDASVTIDAEEIRAKLPQQIVKPVLWEQTLKSMADDGVDTFIEIGPGKTLSGFVKKTLPDVRIYRVEDCETLDKLSEEFFM